MRQNNTSPTHHYRGNWNQHYNRGRDNNNRRFNETRNDQRRASYTAGQINHVQQLNASENEEGLPQ